MIIEYDHTYRDGPTAHVFVQEELKGKHRDHCLCFQGCQSFKPGTPENCPLAEELYQFCVRNNMTTPVWECPVFVAPEAA